MMSAKPQEFQLVLRAQAGDRAAQDELLRGVQATLFHYLLGLAGDRHLAEDVLQEVFVIGLRKLPWLHYQQELSLEEVASVLGLPLGTVESRLAYGLASLRETY